MSEFAKKLLDIIKRTLRRTDNEFDDEIGSYIDTCSMDLQVAGILFYYFDTTREDYTVDPQILQAVRWYCLSVFGLYNTDMDKYSKAYQSLKATLATQGRYTRDYSEPSTSVFEARIRKIEKSLELALNTLKEKQDKLPENDGSTSHRVYVAAPHGFKNEYGEEVKYYLKRIAGYDGSGKSASNGDIGIVTKANRDQKVSEGLITTEDGAYKNYIEHDEPTSISIACRDKEGRLVIEDGTQDFHAVNKRQLDKRVKSLAGSYKIYGKAKAGQDMLYPIDTSTECVQGNIVRRQTDGSIYVPLTPTSDAQAASKKYVDDTVKNASGGGSVKLYRHTIRFSYEYNEETWAEDPEFTIFVILYKTDNTPITSISQLSDIDLLSAYTTNTINLYDAPDAHKIFHSIWKSRTQLCINYLDIHNEWDGWVISTLDPDMSRVLIADIVTEV